MRVLVVNAGSSTLKLTLLDDHDHIVDSRELPIDGSRFDPCELTEILRSSIGEADAVGHRIVHGGERFTQAVRIDTGMKVAMRELCDLAPLHQPKSLTALDAVTEIFRGCLQSRALTPPFTPRCLMLPRPMRCRPLGGSVGVFAATASTGCPMPGSPVVYRNCWIRRPRSFGS